MHDDGPEGTSLAGVPDATARETESWWIYAGNREPHSGIERLPAPPPWRQFSGGPLIEPEFAPDDELSRRLGTRERARAYRASGPVISMVNAALYLRRPLLITGKAGTGKSTLAYSIAYELGLGPVLSWPITTRSTLRDALYRYDAIGRLQEASMNQSSGRSAKSPDIGRFIRLGPLGTALLPQARPRVLLIDELDKSDIDLPNDLLNVFEEGSFEIPELARLPETPEAVEVMVADHARRVPIVRGDITCNAFPIVVITSNGERVFPAPFLRRCVRLKITEPGREALEQIVTAHLGPEAAAQSGAIIERFLYRRADGDIATDQLLNAVYFATSGAYAPGRPPDRVEEELLRPLDSSLTE
jgi:MoxR-like ATPase